MENAEGDRVAGFGELVDGGRERGEVGRGRAVAHVNQLVEVGRAPDIANLLQNLCGLVAIVGVEGAANGVEADPIARAFVAQARAPAAGTFGGRRRAADGVGAGAGDLQNAGAAAKGGVEGDDLVADNFGALDGKIVKDGGDPLGDAGHGGAGHAAGGRANLRDAGLRIDILEEGAQVGFGSFGADAQALDGTAFSEGEGAFAVHDRGARVSATAVDSENCGH